MSNKPFATSIQLTWQGPYRPDWLGQLHKHRTSCCNQEIEEGETFVVRWVGERQDRYCPEHAIPMVECQRRENERTIRGCLRVLFQEGKDCPDPLGPYSADDIRVRDEQDERYEWLRAQEKTEDVQVAADAHNQKATEGGLVATPFGYEGPIAPVVAPEAVQKAIDQLESLFAGISAVTGDERAALNRVVNAALRAGLSDEQSYTILRQQARIAMLERQMRAEPSDEPLVECVRREAELAPGEENPLVPLCGAFPDFPLPEGRVAPEAVRRSKFYALVQHAVTHRPNPLSPMMAVLREEAPLIFAVFSQAADPSAWVPRDALQKLVDEWAESAKLSRNSEAKFHPDSLFGTWHRCVAEGFEDTAKRLATTLAASPAAPGQSDTKLLNALCAARLSMTDGNEFFAVDGVAGEASGRTYDARELRDLARAILAQKGADHAE